MNRLAEKIKKARIDAKLTEKELAQKCGLTVSYILQIESGKKVINEQIADKILKSLGEKMEFITPEDEKKVSEAAKAKVPENKNKIKAVEKLTQPTEQWQNALAGIVQRVFIHDQDNWDILGFREFPVIEGKVEGYGRDKLLYLSVKESDLGGLRLRVGDLILVNLLAEINKTGVYLIEYKNKKIIRKIMKVNNKEFSLMKGNQGEAEIASIGSIRIIGKCTRVEFEL